MPRFILRYRGSGSMRPEDVERIRALPNGTILDSSSGRMMLVDAPEEHLRAALKEMPDWTMMPEQTVPLPDTREKVLHPPDDSQDESKS